MNTCGRKCNGQYGFFKSPLLKLLLFFAIAAHSLFSNAETVFLKIAAPLPIQRLPDLSKEAIRGLDVGAQIGLRWCDSWEATKRELSISLTIWDDGANKDRAVEVAQEIVRSSPNAVIGHINSGTAIPASVIYEEASLTNISLGATNPLFTNRGLNYGFRLAMDDHQLAKLTGGKLKELGINPPTLIHDGTAYGEAVISGISQSFFGASKSNLREGLVVKGKLGPNKEKLNSTEINTVRNAVGLNSVLAIGGMDIFAEAVVESLDKPEKFVFVGGSGLCSQHMAYKVQTDWKSTLYCGSQDIEFDISDQQVNLNSLASTIYSRDFHQPITLTAAKASDAVGIVVLAACRARSVDSRNIVKQMKSEDFLLRGAAGDYQFSKDGRNIKSKAFLYQIDGNGKSLFSVLSNE